MTAPIIFSRGARLEDVAPVQLRVADFDGLVAALDADRAAVKATAPYFCAPMAGKRCAAAALPTRFLAVDADAIDEDVWPDWRGWWHRYRAAAWPTHSSTPALRRERVIVELQRPASRVECIRTGEVLYEALAREFGPAVKLDRATIRPEQPIFLPPARVVIARFFGDPMQVQGQGPTEEDRDLQRRTEDDISHLLFSSVGGVPPDCLPGGPGERNACLFRLARIVKRDMPNATTADLRAIALEWHRQAVNKIETKEPAASIDDFIRGYHAVKTPMGQTMTTIIEAAETAELPTGIESLGYGPAALRLVRLCVALQAHHGDEVFFLSAREAGEYAGLHFTDAAKVLSAFVRDGVLALVSRGAGNKASRYRVAWGAVSAMVPAAAVMPTMPATTAPPVPAAPPDPPAPCPQDARMLAVALNLIEAAAARESWPAPRVAMLRKEAEVNAAQVIDALQSVRPSPVPAAPAVKELLT
jgi:hypothetical protein